LKPRRISGGPPTRRPLGHFRVISPSHPSPGPPARLSARATRTRRPGPNGHRDSEAQSPAGVKMPTDAITDLIRSQAGDWANSKSVTVPACSESAHHHAVPAGPAAGGVVTGPASDSNPSYHPETGVTAPSHSGCPPVSVTVTASLLKYLRLVRTRIHLLSAKVSTASGCQCPLTAALSWHIHMYERTYTCIYTYTRTVICMYIYICKNIDLSREVI
jgi:hypothetical protein